MRIFLQFYLLALTSIIQQIKKITYLQDLEENKNNIENQIFIPNISDDKKGKKQYLKEIDVVIKKRIVILRKRMIILRSYKIILQDMILS